jgi:uncharacterized protein YaaN involved in tellurite resistance
MAKTKAQTATTAAAPKALKETTAPDVIAGSLVDYDAAPPEQKARIDKALAELDLSDSTSVIFFGVKAQQELTTVSDSMLEGVRSKDTGPAGAALSEMLVKLRGFKVDDLAPGKKPGFFARLFGAVSPVARFVQRYEEVRDQVDSVSNRLDGHKTTLMTDIEKLDRLYDANLDYFHDLADYIAAGDEKLRQLDTQVIPAKAAEVEGSEEAIKAQELRDIRQTRAEVREQIERGVVDIESIKQANKLLIETIEDSLRIADEGKAKRAEAEKELVSAESDLRQVLKAASAPKPAPAAEAE